MCIRRSGRGGGGGVSGRRDSVRASHAVKARSHGTNCRSAIQKHEWQISPYLYRPKHQKHCNIKV